MNWAPNTCVQETHVYLELSTIANGFIVICSRQIFPNGLPEDFSFIAMFRLKRGSRKEIWHLLKIADRSGDVQVGIILSSCLSRFQDLKSCLNLLETCIYGDNWWVKKPLAELSSEFVWVWSFGNQLEPAKRKSRAFRWWQKNVDGDGNHIGSALDT